MKEVEADMKELHDEQVNGVTDVSHQMRKVRYHDIWIYSQQIYSMYSYFEGFKRSF